MIRNRFVIRDEHFGATLYDRERLTHKFLLHKEMQSEIEFNKSVVTNPEIWKSNINSSTPINLIYSPLRIYFELTLKCNLRCKTCFNSSGKSAVDEMNTEEVKQTLLGFRNDNILDIRFTGGEVTQRNDWFEILRYAKNLGFTVSLNTNGVYAKKDTLDKLIDLDLDQVTISLDGNEQSHSEIRGKGTYQKALESLKYLSEHNAKLRINTVVTKNVLKDYKDILKVANMYVDEINFFYMRTTGRALEIMDKVVTPADLHQLDLDIEAEKSKYPNLRILHGSQVMLNNSIHNKKFGLHIGGPDGFTRMNLSANGDIYSGGYAPYIGVDLKVGNIKEEEYSMLNVWKNSEKLNKFRAKSLELQMICLNCIDKKREFCPGGSMEMALFSHANPEIGNPYCSQPQNLTKLFRGKLNL
jgi:radical SAM protein with 4Fe4S-binding SPASM domain